MHKVVRELKEEVDLIAKNPFAYSPEGQKLCEQIVALQDIIGEILQRFSDTKRIEKLANDQATMRHLEELNQNFTRLAEQNQKMLDAIDYLKDAAVDAK